ncbi:peptidase M24 family protein [Natrialba magadii ATCC 43099]|uniref:Peptidase M24 n=1 Tax=Natrialba magadii (strain ATCC 43099 / DSM 3394 / CCM 3739 / CIP 104546 / IAM 13178 / JCM 8861 / NBRC 102185 / NCIMB 2190 / MS3) TaxID=547559 RepID=D3ST31_NATMM|nr:M24 family metallopeptidase [Natrialba magadii]ADD04977.1 peptidase M24 family protein [Natrialba magadii ATCC 43099]ELY24024.1 peptidase M24 [Natrialba magadii ATCC 43099]
MTDADGDFTRCSTGAAGSDSNGDGDDYGDGESKSKSKSKSKSVAATPTSTTLIDETLTQRDAAAFVHVGQAHEPAIQYCLDCWTQAVANDEAVADPPADSDLVALSFDGEGWEMRARPRKPGRGESDTHPASQLASTLADRHGSATVLTPPSIPHDAALYLENAGLTLTSTDVLECARAKKTPDERARIETAQAGARAGIRRAAAVLADARVVDGELVRGDTTREDEPITPDHLRTEVDKAIVSAGAYPAGNTAINPDADPERVPSTVGTADTPLRPGEPIVIRTAPREPGGYHGGLVRTLVVDGDGGRERRAHVGATQSFRSASAMLTADTETVGAVKADLEAEVRAFGFEDADAVETSVGGVGLAALESPCKLTDEIEPGSVVQLESAVRVEEGVWLRIADVLARGRDQDQDRDGERPEWLAPLSRSLDPETVRKS